MLLIRRLAQQSHNGAAADCRIKVQVAARHVRLVRVTRPAPAIPLDAVQEELAGVEVQGVGAHVPDLPDAPAAAAERGAILQREVLVLRINAQAARVLPVARPDAEIAERTSRKDVALLPADRFADQCLGRIARLLGGFPVHDAYRLRRVGVLQMHKPVHLAPEIVQCPLGGAGDLHRVAPLVAEGELRRIVGRQAVRRVGADRNRLACHVIGNPRAVGHKIAAVDIDAGKARLRQHHDRYGVVAGRDRHIRPDRVALAVQHGVAPVRRDYPDTVLPVRVEGFAEAGVRVGRRQRPEGRHGAVELLAPVVHLNAVVQLKIPVVPDPSCSCHTPFLSVFPVFLAAIARRAASHSASGVSPYSVSSSGTFPERPKLSRTPTRTIGTGQFSASVSVTAEPSPPMI